MILKKHIFLIAVMSMIAGVASAEITGVTTTLLTNSQANAGTALIDLTPGAAAASGTSLVLPGLALGDGTAEEYLFVNGVGTNDATAGDANVYTSLGTGISTPVFAANSVSESDSFAFVTDADGTAFTTETAIRGADITWSVDTSAYDSGTVYVVFGSFVDFNQVSATNGTSDAVSGFLGSLDNEDPFDTTGTLFDFSGESLANIGTAIAAFEFDNTLGGSPILQFRQINTDADGSRARFYGIIVDEAASFVLGDVDCSGVVDFLDISPFIQLLSTGGFSEKADIDGNLVVDFLDIGPFIAILSGQ